MTDNQDDVRMRGVGAQGLPKKTLGEFPVSDQDIQDLSDRIDRLKGELDDLRVRGDSELPPRS